MAKIEDEVKIGQEVTVRVLSTSNGKLTLSMKPAGCLDAFCPTKLITGSRFLEIQQVGLRNFRFPEQNS